MMTEGSTDPSITMVTGSYASVVQDKQVLKKYDLDISTSDGNRSVEIPDEILDNATPLWEDFLVGKFLDTAPHVAKVHVIVNKIWKQGAESSKIDVYEVDSTTLRFRVRNPMVRSRILKRGMWNIAEVPMVISKWSPRAEGEQPEEKSIPLWVYLKKVPLNMFSWEGLSFITSAVGHPVRLHPETAACSNFEVAKIFVKADLSKDLPTKIRFSKNGNDFWVDFIYPWLPPRCSTCNKWGHLETRCLANLKNMEKDNQPKLEAISKENQGVSLAIEEELVQVSATTTEHGNVQNGMENEKLENIAVNKEDEGGQWITVSPSKAGRSPNRQDGELVQSIISASQFAALTIPAEEGEILDNSIITEVIDTGDSIVKETATGSKTEKELVEGGRPQTSRNSKKKHMENSEISTHTTRGNNLVVSSKRSTRRNL